MAKVKSLAVRGSVGKLGGMVYYNTNGVSLQREEAANVANPNTEAQVDTRSRFKLMSQLAASMKREIAIPRKGLQSGRNRFVKTNFDFVTYEGGAAVIDLNKVQLTDSRRPMGALSVDRSSGTAIQCSVAVKPAMFEKVVVCAYRKSDDEKLEYVGSSIADVDASGTTVLSLPYTSDAVVTYAYGIAYGSAAARAKYGNLEADPAQQVASLIQSSSATAGAARFSKTIGCTMNVGDTQSDSREGVNYIVSVNGSTGEPVKFAGTNHVIMHENIVQGTSLQVKAYKYNGSAIEEVEVFDASYSGNEVSFHGGTTNDYIARVVVTLGGSSVVKNLPAYVPVEILTVNGYFPSEGEYPGTGDDGQCVILFDGTPYSPKTTGAVVVSFPASSPVTFNASDIEVQAEDNQWWIESESIQNMSIMKVQVNFANGGTAEIQFHEDNP